MRSDREKLIELVDEAVYAPHKEVCAIADHLIANGVVVREWIPVTERLPEIVKTTHAWRNVCRKSDRVLCACLQADGKRMVKEGYMEFFNDYPEPNWKIPGTIHSVTHWMPLPEPPMRKGENDG